MREDVINRKNLSVEAEGLAAVARGRVKTERRAR